MGQFFNNQGQQPQEQPIAANPNAACMADVARNVWELTGGNFNGFHGIGPMGSVPGGITDYRVGDNHGGPRPEAVNVIRGAVLALDNQQLADLSNRLGARAPSAEAILNINFNQDQEQMDVDEEDPNNGPFPAA